MSKFAEVNEKTAKGVVEGYKKIEGGIVDGFNKVSNKRVAPEILKLTDELLQ